VRACCLAALGQTDAFRARLRRVLDLPPGKADYLTFRGLEGLFSRLWKASAALPEDDPMRGELEERMLLMGMAPDDFFDRHRQRGEATEGIHFYRVLIRQPLDERWPSWPGCLPGQDAWRAYLGQWGVLAHDEDEATRLVLDWQKRCYPLDAEVENLEGEQQTYTDKAGVVWQGWRVGEGREEEQQETEE
jgi:hypothetical protein